MNRKSLFIWLAYSCLVVLVGIPLLFAANAQQWHGLASTVLAVVTWGLHTVVAFLSTVVALVFVAATANLGDGLAQQLVGAALVFFALGTLQFFVVRGVFMVVRRVFRHVRGRTGRTG